MPDSRATLDAAVSRIAVVDDLERLLTLAEMTQRELARRLGVHPSTVSTWKREGAPEYALAYLRLYVSVREALTP